MGGQRESVVVSNALDRSFVRSKVVEEVRSLSIDASSIDPIDRDTISQYASHSLECAGRRAVRDSLTSILGFDALLPLPIWVNSYLGTAVDDPLPHHATISNLEAYPIDSS